jgi:hypothetical protein
VREIAKGTLLGDAVVDELLEVDLAVAVIN